MEPQIGLEALLRAIASNVALVTEVVCVLCVAFGAAVTFVSVVTAVVKGQAAVPKTRRAIFVGFGGWIILALEFALGADIVRTAIAPSWDDIGQLAAIAAIRTGLNYFLERDIDSAREGGLGPAKSVAGVTPESNA